MSKIDVAVRDEKGGNENFGRLNLVLVHLRESMAIQSGRVGGISIADACGKNVIKFGNGGMRIGLRYNN